MRTIRSFLFLIAIAMLIAACGGSTAASAPAAQAAGETRPGKGLSGGADGAPPREPRTGVRCRWRPDRRRRRRQDHPHRHDVHRSRATSERRCAPRATRSSALGGYVGASTTSNDGDQPSAQITYRIPAANWETALDLLRGLNGLTTKVVTEHTEAVEVTSQVIDLEARIANLRASETAFQGIAAKATKISDVLEVQGQLTQTRGEIETLTAQLKDLNDRAGYASLTVQFNVPILAVEVAQKGWDPASVDRRSLGLDGLGPPGPRDRRDLVRHRVAADPVDRGPRGRHRGRDRAAARLRPANTGWAAARADRRPGVGPTAAPGRRGLAPRLRLGATRRRGRGTMPG